MAVKKYLDDTGLAYVLGKLEEYPDNDILAAVVNAVQSGLDDKVDKANATTQIPTATTSTAGLLSANDKAVINNLNPNIDVTLTAAEPMELIHLVNAKADNIVDWDCVFDPNRAQATRTINLLNVSDVQGNAYINASGVITPSSANGTDQMGPYIAVTPGQDIYYTGITNPEAGSSNKFNRRLHAFDSSFNWISQINYTSATGPNQSWSTHGVVPNNAAYVCVCWNEGDYHIMVTVNEPSEYYPYYTHPITPLSSITLYVGPDDTTANATAYTINIPQEMGTVYACRCNPIEGKIYNTVGYINSYNGETLTDYWWSDRDEYSPTLPPSIGAKVVYVLENNANVEGYDITPLAMPLTLGENYIWVNNGRTFSFTYHAATVAANHFTIYDGATIGNTNVTESDVIAWNNALETLDTKAPLDSPVFTGTPSGPTMGQNDRSSRLATTRYVKEQFNNMVAEWDGNTATASTNYNVGDYITRGAWLYKVIAPITAGDTFVIDTNIEVTSITQELKLLFMALSN